MGDEDTIEDAERETAERLAVDRFLEALLAHIGGPSDATWSALLAAAHDTLPRGDLFTYRIGWAREIETRIGPLLSGDVTTWALLLQGLSRRTRYPGDTFTPRFRAASPFRDRLLVIAQTHSTANPTYYGDTDPIVADAIAGHAGVAISEYETVFVLDRPDNPVEPRQPDDDPGSVGC